MQKAAMAGEVVLEDVLSFEATFVNASSDSAFKKIIWSTLNWVITNRQGMFFGVLLGCLILTLIQVLPSNRKPKSSLTGLLKGVLVGAPLGVCVNCAAPVAYGMHKEGVQTETSLATMFSAPSLNIIVLAMMFSLLPMHLAIGKLVITFVFILLVLPLLLSRFYQLPLPSPAQENSVNDISAVNAAETDSRYMHSESWIQALVTIVKDVLRNLIFIIARTVPLMILAGFLGASMAHLFPMESIATWQVGFFSLLLVALLGTFAPVPIAFDVVLVQALLLAGLAPEFAMALLATLGMFSIYPFMLLWRMLSLKFSFAIFMAIAILGVSSAYAVAAYEAYIYSQNQLVNDEHFGPGKTHNNSPTLVVENAVDDLTRIGSSQPRQNVKPVETNANNSEQTLVYSDRGIRVLQHSFMPKSPASKLAFSRADGSEYSLVSPALQTLDLMLPFSQGRGIASGDFNADGWPDIAIANNQGIGLFKNMNGLGFEELSLPLPELEKVSSLLVAFIDIDNNGCLDLFVGAFGDHDYFLINDCQAFERPQLIAVDHSGSLMTQAAAFSDFDRDGDLDWVKGSWFFLFPRTRASTRNVNHKVLNHGGLNFSQEPLNEIPGATLSVLLSDFDRDKSTDLIIGNDYMEPDIFYRGNRVGGFEMLRAGDGVPATSLATMSLDTADIDNDLDLDIFQAGKTNEFSLRASAKDVTQLSLRKRSRQVLQRKKAYQEDYCDQYVGASDRDRCKAGMIKQNLIRGTAISDCRNMQATLEQGECMIAIQIKNSIIHREWTYCQYIAEELFPVHLQMCNAYAEFDDSSIPSVPEYMYLDQQAIPQNRQGNVLLVQQPDGTFVEKSNESGVFDARWAWTAKFADLG